MDETQARQMKDQHSRDEAELRRSQQISAGDEFSPVESSPQHGAAPPGDGGNEATVVEDYEMALGTERSAWERFRSLSRRSVPQQAQGAGGAAARQARDRDAARDAGVLSSPAMWRSPAPPPSP